MADSNIRALHKVNEILEDNIHGVTTEFCQDQEDLKEIVEATKAIGIEFKKDVRISAIRGKASEVSSSIKAEVKPDVVELEEEPVTEEVDDEVNVEDRNLGNYDDRPIEITVDIASDEDEDEDVQRCSAALDVFSIQSLAFPGLFAIPYSLEKLEGRRRSWKKVILW